MIMVIAITVGGIVTNASGYNTAHIYQALYKTQERKQSMNVKCNLVTDECFKSSLLYPDPCQHAVEHVHSIRCDGQMCVRFSTPGPNGYPANVKFKTCVEV